MSAWRASWRVALRQGRRDVARAKGRSLLVAVMVGTPVLLATVLLGVVGSSSLSEGDELTVQLGSGQAVLDQVGTPIVQDALGELWVARDGGDDPGPQVKGAVAKAERVLGRELVPSVEDVRVTLRLGDRGFTTELRGIDTTKGFTRSAYAVEEGRAPRRTGEILVNRVLADEGATVGAVLRGSHGESLRVVGVGRPDALVRGGSDAGAVVLPQDAVTLSGADAPRRFVVGGDAVGWNDVRALNDVGFAVTSRDVLDHGLTAAQRADTRRAEELNGGADDGTRAVLVIVATSVMIEIVLLACPAFAVGVRRQRRQLALLAANGATPQQLRRTVLGQALVLGVLSSVAAAALGIAIAALVVRVGPDVVPAASFGPFAIAWPSVLLTVVLGSVASVAAAYVPAVQASRRDVATVLAGRRGEVRSRRGLPVVGLVAAAAGVATCFTVGTRPGGEVAVAGSTIAMVVGAVMLTPTLIGLVGRLGGSLPLPLRLAVRDTARSRSRSAPAIAAIMASVAGITAIGIGSTSDFEQSRREYVAQAPAGRAVVQVTADDMGPVLDILEQSTGERWTTIARAGDQRGSVSASSVGDGGRSEYVGDVQVADADTLRAWGVRLTSAQARALRDGQALSSSDGPLERLGRVRLECDGEGPATKGLLLTGRPADLRQARTGDSSPMIHGLVISPATARAHGLPVTTEQAISPAGARALTPAEEADLAERVTGFSPEASLTVERGFQESWTIALGALLAVGGIAVLVGTLTATALALNDARPDFATLAAVGARPRTRRWAAGSQALVLALLGSLLGVVVGFVPGLAVTWPLTIDSWRTDGTTSGPVIAVPWLMLGLLVVVVPVGAALVATLFTRSRLTLVRRVAQ